MIGIEGMRPIRPRDHFADAPEPRLGLAEPTAIGSIGRIKGREFLTRRLCWWSPEPSVPGGTNPGILCRFGDTIAIKNMRPDRPAY